jgi:uncharacterized protein with NRDE domain
MCTLALFLNIIDKYPLLVAANRDEHYDRPATPPALIESYPRIVAGRDLRAGGTWLGVNERGLLVGILNRRANNTKSARSNARSRGLLCMELLALANAAEACEFLRCCEENYNPFTVVYADPGHAGVAFNNGRKITVRSLNAGLHVFSSAAVVDTESDKANRAYGRFMDWATEISSRETTGEWLSGLKKILGEHDTDCDVDPRDAICVHGVESGTVSSSIIYYSLAQRRFESFYCAGAPCRNSFAAPLALDLS